MLPPTSHSLLRPPPSTEMLSLAAHDKLLIPLWGGVGAPARVWALPAKTPPWRPRVCLPGMAVFPSWTLWAGQVGLGQSQGWLGGPGS